VIDIGITTEEFIEAFRQACDDMVQKVIEKNSDYTGDSANPFETFEACEALRICSAETGLLTRIVEKVKRVDGLLKKGSRLVHDEPIQETCLDIANQAIILLIRQNFVARLAAIAPIDSNKFALSDMPPPINFKGQ